MMLALAAVGGFPSCPLMTPTMIAIRAAKEMSPSRNFLIAAKIMLSIDWSPFYRRIRAALRDSRMVWRRRVRAIPNNGYGRRVSPELGTAMCSLEQVEARYSMRRVLQPEGRWRRHRDRRQLPRWRWSRTIATRARAWRPR